MTSRTSLIYNIFISIMFVLYIYKYYGEYFNCFMLCVCLRGERAYLFPWPSHDVFLAFLYTSFLNNKLTYKDKGRYHLFVCTSFAIYKYRSMLDIKSASLFRVFRRKFTEHNTTVNNSITTLPTVNFPTRWTTHFGFARFTTKIIFEGKSYFGQRGGSLDVECSVPLATQFSLYLASRATISVYIECDVLLTNIVFIFFSIVTK